MQSICLFQSFDFAGNNRNFHQEYGIPAVPGGNSAGIEWDVPVPPKNSCPEHGIPANDAGTYIPAERAEIK